MDYTTSIYFFYSLLISLYCFAIVICIASIFYNFTTCIIRKFYVIPGFQFFRLLLLCFFILRVITFTLPILNTIPSISQSQNFLRFILQNDIIFSEFTSLIFYFISIYLLLHTILLFLQFYYLFFKQDSTMLVPISNQIHLNDFSQMFVKNNWKIHTSLHLLFWTAILFGIFITCFFSTIFILFTVLAYYLNTLNPHFEWFKWFLTSAFFPILHFVTVIFVALLGFHLWFRFLRTFQQAKHFILLQQQQFLKKRKRKLWLQFFQILILVHVLCHIILYIKSILNVFVNITELEQMMPNFEWSKKGLVELLFFVLFEWFPLLVMLFILQYTTHLLHSILYQWNTTTQSATHNNNTTEEEEEVENDDAAYLHYYQDSTTISTVAPGQIKDKDSVVVMGEEEEEELDTSTQHQTPQHEIFWN